MSNPTALVQKLWNYCNILRDDGLSYGDLASQARHQLVSKMTTCGCVPNAATSLWPVNGCSLRATWSRIVVVEQ